LLAVFISLADPYELLLLAIAAGAAAPAGVQQQHRSKSSAAPSSQKPCETSQQTASCRPRWQQ
jgi:hypothetical protein